MAHILIVDDETGIRESLAGILEEEGYKTSATASAEECLDLLRRYGSLEDPALGPLMDAARRRFGTAATDPIPI